MTNPGPSQGWKVRRDKARAKHEVTDERAAVRAERQRMADEKLAADLAAAAEYAKTQARARCSCPVCDAGPVDLELAARIVTALAKLPAHVPTDPNVIAALHAVVGGREIPRSTIYGEAHAGLRVPRRVYADVTPADHRAADVTPKDAPVTAPTKGKH